ncbi:sulfur carrier protein ThiS adenylyltransferase ThiF [Clostridium formicaceticum]|uniref:Adenylyltransferase/sulfurtransferase MoeZ n=1 Tax=Clostridium formicaceticum TaxID=1497 RepID=A0AAC9WI19_9CLOT|nr:sulfur carrier protein ThiS adenylyltransferase ThiF [Clostridium formicaceticum]AOY75248.1 thiamine biosynthesis protein ThiF [Clostridium formicaceticum]ARE89682.1 putative adenylyltransferase/sulfurtransferase MoeZ [Clostridium formicaceticum]
MKIFLNEGSLTVEEGLTAFEIRDRMKKDADVVILNGFIIKEDGVLQAGDRVTLIKKGEMPSHEELETLLVARHTPGVHEKVKKAAVGIAGLGGLGSNIAISLARIGIGKLVLIDFDVVEPSNLNRQQYFVKHIGMLKTEAMKELISLINPFVEVEVKNLFLDAGNIENCFKEVDIIVEAFDNPLCKAELVNTALEKLPQKPIVAASGMAGYFSSNTVQTKKVMRNLYLVGDEISEAKPGCGLMAPRVAIAANHQANMVLRLILEEREV